MIQPVVRCAFCGGVASVFLIRVSDHKKIPVCRDCVPRRTRLSWAENPMVDALEAAKVLADMQESRLNQ